MKITIEADSKEIADLVLAVQDRRNEEIIKTVELFPDNSNSIHAEAIRGMREASRKERNNAKEANTDI